MQIQRRRQRQGGGGKEGEWDWEEGREDGGEGGGSESKHGSFGGLADKGRHGRHMHVRVRENAFLGVQPTSRRAEASMSRGPSSADRRCSDALCNSMVLIGTETAKASKV